MDLASFAPLIGYAFQKGKLTEVLSDVGVYLSDTSIIGGKFTPASIDAIDKAGEAVPTLGALVSIESILSDMLRDPAHHADGIAVMKALASAAG